MPNCRTCGMFKFLYPVTRSAQLPRYPLSSALVFAPSTTRYPVKSPRISRASRSFLEH